MQFHDRDRGVCAAVHHQSGEHGRTVGICVHDDNDRSLQAHPVGHDNRNGLRAERAVQVVEKVHGLVLGSAEVVGTVGKVTDPTGGGPQRPGLVGKRCGDQPSVVELDGGSPLSE